MLLRLGLLILIYVAAVLETGGDPGASTGGVRLCWLFLAALIAVWQFSAPESAAWGALVGLVGDVVGPGALGVELVIVCLVTWGATRLRTRWDCSTLLALGLLAISVVGLLLLVCGIAQAVQARQPIPWERLGIVTAGGAAATGLLALLATAVWRTVRFSVQQFLRAQRALA
jgi:rod shape-determining protein MreD